MSERYSIVDWSFQDYIENGYQYKGRKYESMNKRGLSTIATLFLCLTLLLSACSNGTSTNTGSEGKTSVAQTATKSQTKVVSTIKGDVEIPVNPERVVVMYYTGDVLAFGVTPVGSSKIQDGAAFEEALKTVESLGEWFEPNVEAVIQLKPDVIIIPKNEELYGQMKKIAPTIVIDDATTSLDQRLEKIGEVLGKEKEAKDLLTNFYTKVEDSKEQLKAAGVLDKTVSIMEGGKGKMSVVTSYTFGRGSQALYEYLGMSEVSLFG